MAGGGNGARGVVGNLSFLTRRRGGAEEDAEKKNIILVFSASSSAPPRQEFYLVEISRTSAKAVSVCFRGISKALVPDGGMFSMVTVTAPN